MFINNLNYKRIQFPLINGFIWSHAAVSTSALWLHTELDETRETEAFEKKIVDY